MQLYSTSETANAAEQRKAARVGQGPALVLALGFLLSALQGTAAAQEGARSVHPTPDGFVKYLAYLGESTLSPGDPSLLVDLESVRFFQEVIMKRSPEEAAADQAAAEEFFLQRFSLNFIGVPSDPDGVKTIQGAVFMGFFLAPEVNYRAYTVSGDFVPSSGWEVRDGGWLAMLTEDMILFGEYGGPEGKLAPAGSMFVFGDYNIKVTRPRSKARFFYLDF
jgi:hypothetical protein